MLSPHITLAYDRGDGATTRAERPGHSQAGTGRFWKGAQLARDNEAGSGYKSIVVVLTPRCTIAKYRLRLAWEVAYVWTK